MYNVLLGIDIILAVFLCCLVMLQRSDGGALGGLGGGTGSSFMTGRSVGNALTKATAIIAALFFATSLALGVLAKQSAKPKDNIMKNLPAQTVPAQKKANAPAKAEAPVKAEESAPVETPAEAEVPAKKE